MKTNVGKADRNIRLFLGLLLVIAGFYYSYWFMVIGAVILLTAVFSLCLLYLPFGITTKPSVKK